MTVRAGVRIECVKIRSFLSRYTLSTIYGYASLAPINGPLSLVRSYQQPINNPQKLGIVEQNR